MSADNEAPTFRQLNAMLLVIIFIIISVVAWIIGIGVMLDHAAPVIKSWVLSGLDLITSTTRSMTCD